MKLELNTRAGYIITAILFLSPLMRFSWDTGPQTLACLASLLLILTLSMDRKLVFNLYLLLPCAAFAGVSLVSLFANSNQAVVRDGLLVLVSSLAMAYAASAAPEQDIKTILLFPVLAGFAFSVVILSRPLFNLAGFGADSTGFLQTIVNFNVLAGYSLLVLPLSFIFWENGGYPALIISLAIFFSITATGSRTASVCALGILLIYSLVTGKERKKLSLYLGLVLLSATAILLLSKSGLSQSLFDRAAWWRTALAMFLARPFTGVGWGNFGDYFLVYRPAAGLNSIYAHNLVLQVAAETGVFGLSAFTLLIYYFYKLLNGPANRSGSARSLYLPLMLSVSGFLLYNLFDYGFFIPALMYLFFFILGLAFRGNSGAALKYRLPPAACLLILCAAGFFLVQPLIAGVYYNRSSYFFKLRDYEKAERYAERSLKHDALNWLPYSRLAEINFTRYTQTGAAPDLEASVKMQREALMLFPQCARLYSDLAWLYLEGRHYPEALQAIRSARFYDRFNPRYADTSQNIERMLRDASKK